MLEYKGPLDPKKFGPMPNEARKAYMIWGSQKTRNTRNYTSREFIAWWLHNIKLKKWKFPQCGRIDHDKGYSFDNIKMEERSDNTKERNSRKGNPGRSHRAVFSFYRDNPTVVRGFPSKVSAARFYGIDEKTVYNHCMGKSKDFNNGPITKTREVSFRWAR